MDPQVLVIEPDPVTSSDLCRLLQAWGALTYSAGLGEDAEMLLQRQQYQLILLSLKADVDKALGLVRQVRAPGCNSTTPVVGMALESQAPNMGIMLEAGVSEVLTTPTSVRAIARVYWYWLSPERLAIPDVH